MTLLMLFMLSSNVLWRIDLFTAYDIARKPKSKLSEKDSVISELVDGSWLTMMPKPMRAANRPVRRSKAFSPCS
jgi:hypothetical protein